MQHVFSLLGDHKTILNLCFFLGSEYSTAGLRFFFFNLNFFGWFLGEVIETFYKLFGEKSFVFLEASALRSKGCIFDILYFKFDGFGRYGGNADIKMRLHKIIITVTKTTLKQYLYFFMVHLFCLGIGRCDIFIGSG